MKKALFAVVAIVLVACGGSVDAEPSDAGADTCVRETFMVCPSTMVECGDFGGEFGQKWCCSGC